MQTNVCEAHLDGKALAKITLKRVADERLHHHQKSMYYVSAHLVRYAKACVPLDVFCAFLDASVLT